MRSKFFITLLALIFAIHTLAQENGFIRGTVFDTGLGETLPGVTVLVVGTTIGTITDLDGEFSIPIGPGTYEVSLSFISYDTKVMQDVLVESGEVNYLGEIGLEEASIELEEVTVSASAIRNTETALMAMKQNSANVVDGISSAGFRKIGDANAASSMRRVSGVSVIGGRYVYVRGLGDRYTKTILNGVDVPGLDPDRNSLQMDLFPTTVIDNIIVNKSFTAELPADFTGGVINIVLKDFPERKRARAQVSLGYNPSMHFNSDYLTYNGGQLDWLAIDDGARDIPANSNIPSFVEAVSNPEGPNGQRFREILENFNPNMGAYKQNSLMDFKGSFTIGNQWKGKKDQTLGYNIGVFYANETEFYKDARFGRWGLSSDPDVFEMDVREDQVGDYGVNNVLWSVLGGFAIKNVNSKYRFTVLHLQNGESKAGIFDYEGSDQGSNFFALQHNLDYSQRSLSNALIAGDHYLAGGDWKLNWKFSPTLAMITDPDVRFVRYQIRGNSNPVIGTEVGFPERIWRDLDEFVLPGIVDVTKEFDLRGRPSKLKFGGAYTYKERDYLIESFALNVRNIPLTGDPDELFRPENLWPYQDDPTRGTTYEARFIPTNPNQFNSSAQTIAAYVSAELSLHQKLKAILGVRMENYTQRYTGTDQLQVNVLDNDVVLDNIDFFPSLNFIFSFTKQQNLRLSFTQTIARPSFKELSYAEIYDPITGRTFIGGLFEDADPGAGIVYWNGKLQSTNIFNFDLRWEYFGLNGQMLSLSGFYKIFQDPIEVVQYATQTGSFQPRNVGDGEVFGAEAETRYDLGRLTYALNNFGFLVNFTYTISRIKLSPTEFNSRVENARTGQSIDEYRDMAGQAPYIVNVGLFYNGGERGFAKGLEAGFYYNVQGQTLQFVGIVDRPDIYTIPFNSLDFNSWKTFGKDDRYRVGFKVENILNDKKELVFVSHNANDQFFTSLAPGTKISVRFAFDIF